MTIESLKINLMQERKLIDNILVLYEQFNEAAVTEKNFFANAIFSLLNQIDIINNSVPRIMEEIKSAKQLPIVLQRESDIRTAVIGQITLEKKDRQKYLKELDISKRAIHEIKKKTKEVKFKEISPFKKPNQLASASSKIFGKMAFNMSEKGSFRFLNTGLRKANMPYLLSTYLSLMFFFTLAVFVVAIFAAVLFTFFKVGYASGQFFPSFTLNTKELGLRLLTNLLYSLLLPVVTFFGFMLYPSGEAASLKSKIDNELPFAVLHMSSIAGSGVEPSRIFKIIATNREYPAVGKEIRKIVNQVNLYGYDLVTALRNTAKSTSNDSLAGLLNGLATNISSGGTLKEYLDKKASDTILDYKLSRKRYGNMAETSMDIYIGVLIAAPLIFMILLIMINAIGMSFAGLNIVSITVLIVGGTVLLNIGFLIFLKFRQPPA